MTTAFYHRLDIGWKANHSLLCVGLDPNKSALPPCLDNEREPLFVFNREIIDATAASVCAYKPQIAYYAAHGAEGELEKTIHYIKDRYPNIPVILDAKRGDIGATAKMYAVEAFERYGADAVTVNPYMGGDTLEPFLDYQDKGVIILCRTSNPGSGDLQQLAANGKSIAHHVATQAAEVWNGNENIALVVGATYPEEIGAIRGLVGDMPLLIPGIGAQGGDLQAVLENGLTAAQQGLMINVSRSVINASRGSDFAEAAGKAAMDLTAQINHIRTTLHGAAG